MCYKLHAKKPVITLPGYKFQPILITDTDFVAFPAGIDKKPGKIFDCSINVKF